MNDHKQANTGDSSSAKLSFGQFFNKMKKPAIIGMGIMVLGASTYFGIREVKKGTEFVKEMKDTAATVRTIKDDMDNKVMPALGYITDNSSYTAKGIDKVNSKLSKSIIPMLLGMGFAIDRIDKNTNMIVMGKGEIEIKIVEEQRAPTPAKEIKKSKWWNPFTWGKNSKPKEPVQNEKRIEKVTFTKTMPVPDKKLNVPAPLVEKNSKLTIVKPSEAEAKLKPQSLPKANEVKKPASSTDSIKVVNPNDVKKKLDKQKKKDGEKAKKAKAEEMKKNIPVQKQAVNPKNTVPKDPAKTQANKELVKSKDKVPTNQVNAANKVQPKQ